MGRRARHLQVHRKQRRRTQLHVRTAISGAGRSLEVSIVLTEHWRVYSLITSNGSGGCCRNGWGCAASSCVPPTTVTQSSTCMPSSTMCPDSVGGGCCPYGYSCGVTICSPPTTILPTTITVEDVTITRSGSTVTATQIITKGSEQPIDIKISPTSSDSSYTTFTIGPTHLGSTSTTFPRSAIIGIACGVVGLLFVALGGWWTYRKVNRRGNTEPSYQSRDRDIVAVPTRNAYHPDALPMRHQDTRRWNSFRRSPTAPQPFDFGFSQPNVPPAARDIKLENNLKKTDPDVLEENKDAQPASIVELQDTSVSTSEQPGVHEVEGDHPEGRTRRWSAPLARHFKRGSRGSNEAGSPPGPPQF
jgi:hypothetical protein